MEAEFRGKYADCNALEFVTERTAQREENRTVERLGSGERGLQCPGGVLPQILDRGVPRRFLKPNPI